ncbi:MAG: glycosyltransferase [Pirellulales bacterium]|nr:glycosyltransferase [Pirellulales bacterium]
MSSFVIVDPSLRTFNGHFLHYDNAVAGAARDRGYRVVTLAGANVSRELPCQFRAVPCFRRELEEPFFRPGLTNALAVLRFVEHRLRRRAFLQDLNRATKQLELDASSIVFVHTLTEHYVKPLVDWLAALPAASRPRLCLLLRYAPSPNPCYPNAVSAQEYRRGLEHLESSPVRPWVTLLTDSAQLQQEYGDLTELPLHVLPIPHARLADDQPCAAATRIRTMTYLGNARSTKGFQYLPFVIEELRDEFESGAWQAEFQANVMFAHDAESQLALTRLRSLPVRLHDRELTETQYAELLERSALVVIPYQQLYYYAQTSGVLSEAISAGKPVVVPRGTWMADQVKRHGVGTLFLPGDRISLVEAVRDAMWRIDELQAASCDARDQWLRTHNPKQFLDSLLTALAA